MNPRLDPRFHPEQIHPTAFVAPTASIMGDVTVGPFASVWHGAVIRGDTDRVVIGEGTNIQDGCIVHVDPGAPTTIGSGVTLGHGAMVHSSSIADNVLVGMGAILIGTAQVGEDSIIGAGAVVTEGTVIPPGSLVLGVPARVAREVTPEQRQFIRETAQHYREYAQIYREQMTGS